MFRQLKTDIALLETTFGPLDLDCLEVLLGKEGVEDLCSQGLMRVEGSMVHLTSKGQEEAMEAIERMRI